MLREATTRRLASMRAELAGATPSPLEKLLVDRVVLCWLQLSYADCVYAQNIAELSLAQAEYHQRRLTLCQGRYLSAIRTLALIRRASRPAMVQVNIGERQVNVATAAGEADTLDGTR